MNGFILYGERSFGLPLSILSGALVQIYLHKKFDPFTPTTPHLLLLYVAANLVLGIRLLANNSSSIAILHQAILNVYFLGTLITLTVIRRLYFHPLSRFPGPRLAAATKLYAAYHSFKGDFGRVLQSLQHQYGDIVRVGPEDLAIFSPETNEKVLSRRTGSLRGEVWENASYAMGGRFVNFERDPEVHQRRRKVWDRALASKELNSYAPRLEMHVSKFVELIEQDDEKFVDIVNKMTNLTTDIMGDLGFGAELGSQDKGKSSIIIESIHSAMNFMNGIMAMAPLAQLLPYLPESPMAKKFKQYTDSLVRDRLPQQDSRNDVFSHFLKEEQDSRNAPELVESDLTNNSRTFFIAATDTTSSVLSCAFTELARNPHIQKNLQAELDAAFSDPESICVRNSSKSLKYTEAVINESLRLWPALQQGSAYVTKPSGVYIQNTFIPGGTTVSTPLRALFRDDRNFPHGEEFIPERWTSRPELVKERSAFIPFSYGPHSCPGKHLAKQEMNLVLAQVFRRFDVSLSTTFDYSKFQVDIKDYFAASVPPTFLLFKKRT